MSNLDKFIETRGIKKAVGDAFIAYCRFQFAQQYDLHKAGDTIKAILGQMTEDQVKEAWNEFLKDLRSTLPEQ